MFVLCLSYESSHSTSIPLFIFILPGELQYSPAVLQQRMTAELQYLESIEESVRQLGDVEKLMGVSMAQQESASLAQMLKVNEVIFSQCIYLFLILGKITFISELSL